MISNFINNINSALNIFRQNDARAKIQSRDLISTLMLSMDKDNRKMSIASLRRSVMSESLVRLARSTFWQRLASSSLTRKIQQCSLKLVNSFKGTNSDSNLEKLIGVNQIFLVDSTSITLKDSAKHVFPGSRNNVAPAVVKWHVMFDITKSEIPWCDISKGTSNDCIHFPIMAPMIGSLTIFDLGYYDYYRMSQMDKLGMFFLSRVKSRAIAKIISIKSGIHEKFLGEYFSNISVTENQSYVEFTADFGPYEGLLIARVIGFWNNKENKYHWYMTNLKCESRFIFPLYKLRWQIELVFKTVKSSFCFEDLCSANKQIILNLLLLRMNLAFIFFPTLALIFEEIKFKEKMSLSIQRAGTIFRWLLPELKALLNQTGSDAERTLVRLNKMIEILKFELSDPNYQKRKSTISLCLEPLETV